MPVTKKKGAIFPIYADTPPRSTSSIRGPAPPTSSSSSSSQPQSPTGTRRALTSLRPTPTSSSSLIEKPQSSKPSRKLSVFADEPSEKPRSTSSASSRKLAVYADEPSKASSKTKPSSSRPALGDKSNARSLSTSAIDTYKSKSKSSSSTFKVFTDSTAAPKRRVPSPVTYDKENIAAVDPPSRHTRSKTAPVPAKPVEKKKGGAANPRLRSIPILADVSEAYGASGDEPLGFRD